MICFCTICISYKDKNYVHILMVYRAAKTVTDGQEGSVIDLKNEF